MYNNPHFAPKPTFARIDFLRQGWRLVDRKGSQNVKIYTEKLTRNLVGKNSSWQVNELTSWQDFKLMS